MPPPPIPSLSKNCNTTAIFTHALQNTCWIMTICASILQAAAEPVHIYFVCLCRQVVRSHTSRRMAQMTYFYTRRQCLYTVVQHIREPVSIYQCRGLPGKPYSLTAIFLLATPHPQYTPRGGDLCVTQKFG